MTIFRKSIVVLGLGAAGLSAILVTAAVLVIDYHYFRSGERSLLNTARVLIAAVGMERIGEYCAGGGQTVDSTLQKDLEAIRDSGDYRLSLIDVSGNVLWDTTTARTTVNHNNRREIQSALSGKGTVARRDSFTTGGEPSLYAAVPVYNGDTVAGVFRLSVAVPGFWQRLAPAGLPFFVCAAALVLAAIAAAAVFSRSLAGSLGRLVTIAETAAGGGNYRNNAAAAASGEAEEFHALETALQCMAEQFRQRAEQAEADGRQSLAILNGMSEAVFAMNDKLVLYLANPRACSLFALGAVQDVSLLAATRSTELENAARTVLAEGRSLEVEIKLKAANGDARMEQRFQVFAAPLFAPAGVVMVLENITRLVRLEQMRKDFVANVSHELRTPIQLIKGFSETLLDAPPGEVGLFRRGIEIIRKNAGTMENLTNDLLVLANLEENVNDNSRMEEQALAPLFAEAVLSVEPQAKARKIHILVNCPDHLRAVVHGSFIIQALINLLDNGIKYSPKKSQLWASAYRENGHIVLEVKDEGIGISGEHLERIFERFYRVDRSHSRETGGTGLGLSIVRHIALLHNGTAEVHSHAGEGSVFRIRIAG